MTGDAPTEAERAERRRRLERVFGESSVSSGQTSDDTEDPVDRRAGERATEEWLRRQVPPHHD